MAQINLSTKQRDFPGGPVIEAPCSQCRGPVSDSWSGNYIPHATTKSSHATTEISHMLQLKIPHAATKIPRAATKTQQSQINKY